MTIVSSARVRALLKAGELKVLFIEELGWDRYDHSFALEVDGLEWSVTAVAEKRGLVAYVVSNLQGSAAPDYQIRRKIEAQVAKVAHEHLIVFAGPGNSQVWQWVRREPGKPTAVRETHLSDAQTGESLAQKLEDVAFHLSEEEGLTLIEVTRRVREGF